MQKVGNLKQWRRILKQQESQKAKMGISITVNGKEVSVEEFKVLIKNI